MRTSRALVVSAVISTTLGLLALGCYRPNVVSGGLACADGGVCPDGFHCSKIDNRCYSGDGGPEVTVCTDAAPMLLPVCNDPPPSGSECNPACQDGCTCGRCTVSGPKAVCTTVGSKTVGELCDLANDNCAVGLGCVKDGCGTNLGRCRQFCRSSAECVGGCNPLVGTISVCEPPPQVCDPVTGMGCPDPALACYLESNQSLCDCRGSGPLGSTCTFSSDCLPGLTCITFANPPSSSCRVACSSAANCGAGETCFKSSGNFGFCQAQ